MTNSGAREIQRNFFLLCMAIMLTAPALYAQQKPLLLSEAIANGLSAYPNIKAKQFYIQSSQALVKNARNERLPNVEVSLQQSFGTINGLFGPLSGFGGVMGVASSGPPHSSQNWNAGFGASYIMNTNWEFFTFGRRHSRISLSQAQVDKDSADLAREAFMLSAKIAGAYLNLIIVRKIADNAEANLKRTQYIQEVVQARTRSGLNAGVDSSIANAEVASAKLALIASQDNELQIRNQLAQLLNTDPLLPLELDTSYLEHTPQQFNADTDISVNPQAKFYDARVRESEQHADYLKKSILPGLNLFGIYQTRGSGFGFDYSPYQGIYSKSYWEGIKPSRSNYLAGISIAWNILSIKKIKEQETAQRFISSAYRQEYDLLSAQLRAQLALADQRIEYSLIALKEAPVQYKAAADAYNQKSVLYKNGLTNIIDVQQALYAVNKAETNLAGAYIQVWQALLLKAAASGDLDLFLKQIR
mgnify:CR=1 FL=1